MWPAHGVQGTRDAEFYPGQIEKPDDIIIQKGTQVQLDAYSAFFDNARLRKTGLDSQLQSLGIQRLYLVGLALDYCVAWTACDAASLGYDTTVITSACRAIGNATAAKEKLKKCGVKIIDALPPLP